MDENVQIFNHDQFGQLRAVSIEEKMWIVAKDVALSLGYSNPSKAINDHVDDEDKLYNDSLSSLGQRGGWLINESGMYSMILHSKLPQAKTFKRWVTHEVLPSIRRTGGYMATPADEPREVTLSRALLIMKESLERAEEENASLKFETEAMAPKAALCDAMLLPSEETWTISEAARYLRNIVPGIKRQDVFDVLRSTGMMCKRGTAPTYQAARTGRMVAVAGEYRDESGEVRAGRQRGKLTAKGIGWLTAMLGGRGLNA